MQKSLRNLFIVSIFSIAAVSMAYAHSESGGAKKASVIIKDDDVLEKCVKVEPSRKLHYLFTASKPLNFNLHYHLVDETIFHVKEETTERNEIFTPVKGQKVYCMEWNNHNEDDVSLQYEYSIDD